MAQALTLSSYRKSDRVLTDDRVQNEHPALIDIGSCGLHTVHGAFKFGAQSTGWKLKEILCGSYEILHDSPARRDDYQSFSNSVIYPLKFCATW